MESALGFLISLTAALVFGFMAYISLYKTYSGKMRTYSIVWMVALPLALLFALFGISFIGLIIMITIYVFLMIALLEKKNAEL